ncbi:D-alanyl-D-alanine carboxypeptidase/D-alanyl-D-alanine-endopeptidase (penicillin-binding protein 4) [Acidovorax sp. 62]|uniref:D-alanyl-D-alanine carboxypeptidase/D-alanyl-D-alanine endopeptidase n=1 Tax=Acidovorax sp. 62 TaxID=2035203 RepID=UPI000C1769E3|nr:D-alanyl-D-alanine carboxypeptidase/D-alanyl-D-alanine-endopeptidase [Acidovorax sp. 62]PIF92297.1 D-alanyl-D-alanine carboxypeptidase/D-alanyl-D-alanine-endopeptidase (penicillin-binding protein 4) [Acidovorax sp. 62]
MTDKAPWRRTVRQGLVCGALACGAAWGVGAQAQAVGAALGGLPPEIEAALARSKLPRDAISVLVADAQGGARTAPRLSYRAQVPVNPASVMKLVTTYAALDQLGPAYTWSTPVFVEGPVQGGSLKGNVYIQGQGDPKLVVERLWLLMRRLQTQGIQVIVGDIVLDRSAFDVPEQDPGRFDGEPLRPYNASPDALLLNYKSSVMTFVPDGPAGVARIQYDPPLAGVQRPATVALAAAGAECGDWRGALRAELGDPLKVSFQGAYPASCGERVWPVAYPAPRDFAARAVEGMWRELGGKLTGTVRDGKVPAGLKPAFVSTSPALAEVVRDVNKYSNNVMAQHVFLALARQKGGVATMDGAREALRQWWQARFADVDAPVPDNGAGLSREARVTALGLGRMLQSAWASPVMPELVASLPIAGVDGTLRRSQSRGAAHLKTGSLRDVMAVAGYVHAQSGKRYVLVAIVNHPNANAARPVLDAITDWAARD